MRNIFIFSLILISNIGFARKEYLINLKGDSLFYKNLRFEIIDVIDKRINQDNIGYTMKGVFEVNRPVNFRNGFTKTLKNYMTNLIQNDTPSIQTKIAIKELLITEDDLSIQQIGSCHLIMEFYDNADNLIYMTDYTSSFSSFDATKKYEDLIKHLIKKSFLTFNLYNPESNIYYDLINQNISYDSILLCEIPRKGFYANFKEFQANNPSLQFDFDVIKFEEKENEYSKIKLTDPLLDPDKLFSLIYGFSDGKNIYVKRYVSERYYTFIPIQSIGRYCYVGKKDENQGVPIILPFAIGILSVPYEQDYIMNISSGNEHPLTYQTLKAILASDIELYDRYMSQPFETREKMGLYWMNEYNRRYIERRKK